MKKKRGGIFINFNKFFIFNFFREQSEETLLNLLEETCNRLDAASKI